MKAIGTICGIAIVMLPPLALIAVGVTAIVISVRGAFTDRED